VFFVVNLPTAFTTDYADSADSSVIAEHPRSSVTSVVKNSESVLRVFRVFRGQTPPSSGVEKLTSIFKRSQFDS
jgi:hypothetical protein